MYRLFPYGKSGLKSQRRGLYQLSDRSLPVWEEWIEINFPCPRNTPLGRLFPYGKSGLKSVDGGGDGVQHKSLPVWEEWIEIVALLYVDNPIMSLPVWEEWIEMTKKMCLR